MTIKVVRDDQTAGALGRRCSGAERAVTPDERIRGRQRRPPRLTASCKAEICEIATAAAVLRDPGLEARYLKCVLPLVAQVKVGMTWAETH